MEIVLTNDDIYLILFALLQIIIIDLILGIDNALVIALAAKNLSPTDRKKATLIGVTLAIVIRTIFVMIFIAIGEFNLPLFYFLGGLLLVKIG